MGLEFALACMELQLDETLTALQFGVQGRIPFNLVPPSILKNILANVSHSLPDSYELTKGITDDLSWYYKFVTADIVAASEGFLLILSLPLKDMSTHFEVFIIFTFPFELFNGTYARLQLDRPYFAINLAQQAHLWLTDADIKKCSGGQGIRACPADVPVLSNDLPTCPLSLYLQLGQTNTLCNHELLRSVPTSRLLRHGALVLYHTMGYPGVPSCDAETTPDGFLRH
jgi:hypothetical protein